MAETERFEAQLQAALAAYADEVPTTVDAVELARSIATAERERGWRRLFPTGALEAWSGTLQLVRLGLVLCALALLTAALVVLAQRIAPLPTMLTGRMGCVGSPWAVPTPERLELDCTTELADERATGAASLVLEPPAGGASPWFRSGSMKLRTRAMVWLGSVALQAAPNGVAVSDVELEGYGAGPVPLVLRLHLVTTDGVRWGLSGMIRVAG